MRDATTPGKVLVTGATGTIGSELVERLRADDHPFRVLCRRPEQLEAFAAWGGEASRGDREEPASVRAAAGGCEQLFLLQPAVEGMGDVGRRAVRAALEAGVERVVRVSASDAADDSPIPWGREHARADRSLADADVPWTVLKPAAFMSNLLRAAPAVRRGLLPGMSGRGATPWIDPADIADAACAVLTDRALQGGPGGDGRTYLLTGTPPVSFPELASLLSARLGRRVRYLHVPAPLALLGLRASGVDAWMARGLVAQFAVVVREGRDGVRETSSELETLLGRPPKDLTTYVADHLDAFR
jgi:uncharacterized protein YbjT (DUF2867 family)